MEIKLSETQKKVVALLLHEGSCLTYLKSTPRVKGHSVVVDKYGQCILKVNLRTLKALKDKNIIEWQTKHQINLILTEYAKNSLRNK